LNLCKELYEKKYFIFLALFIIVLIVAFYNSSNHQRFSIGEKVHVTKSGLVLALQDGGPVVFPAEAWWRFTVSGYGSDGWVQLTEKTDNLKRWVKQSVLSKGWISADKYLAPQIKQEEEKMSREVQQVHLPSAAELKKEQEEANSHVTPSSKILALSNKINTVFSYYGESPLLENCKRYNNSNFLCSVNSAWGGGNAYVTSNIVVGINFNNTHPSKKFLEGVCLPLIASFMPTAPNSLIKIKLKRFLSIYLSGQKRTIALYPFYGSISYRNRANYLRITINGSPMRPFVNGKYASSYSEYTHLSQ